MKRVLAFFLMLLTPLSAFAQDPQTSAAPIYAVNSKYVQGVAPGFWPTAGSGLTLDLTPGTSICANVPTTYAGGSLTMSNNTTNYVYLDTTASCAPASNTSGFSSTTMPIAKVVTASGAITTITDVRLAPTTGSLGGPSGTAGGDLSGSYPNPTIATGLKTRAIPFYIGDPNGSVLASGSTTTDYVTVPFACTISAYNLLIDAGTITVKFWKIATGTAIPTSSNSISTSGVGISSGTAIHSTTVTDFTTTTVTANDIMAMNVTAVSTAKFVNGVLECDQ